MKIKRIKFKNFKSFDDIDLNLQNVNIIIGGNASGKSNFVEIFKFLSNIQKSSLENAIEFTHGIEYFFNTKIKDSKNFYLEIEFEDIKISFFDEETKEPRREEILSCIKYILEIRFLEKGEGTWDFEIIKEEFSAKYGNQNIIYYRDMDSTHFEPEFFEEEFGKFFSDKLLKDKHFSLLNVGFMEIIPFLKFIDFRKIGIYNINPKYNKKFAQSLKFELDEYCENLPEIITRIIKNPIKRDKFIKLIKFLIPFITEIGTERLITNDLVIKIKEEYNPDYFYPTPLISEGTIDVIALITILFFEPKDIIIIEEPEKNLHPSLITKLMELIAEISEKKQIIITTHSPEFIRNSKLDQIFLISRNKKGFSEITRPSENQEVKEFLKNEIGLEELFINNLLG